MMNTETSEILKIKTLNITKADLHKDLDQAIEFDQSQLFKKVYENEFGSPGGEAYGLLIGDYEFTNHPNDIDLLEKVSNVAAAAFCPFISAASSLLAGMDSWTEITNPARFGEDIRLRRVCETPLLPRDGRFTFRRSNRAASVIKASVR